MPKHECPKCGGAMKRQSRAQALAVSHYNANKPGSSEIKQKLLLHVIVFSCRRCGHTEPRDKKPEEYVPIPPEVRRIVKEIRERSGRWDVEVMWTAAEPNERRTMMKFLGIATLAGYGASFADLSTDQAGLLLGLFTRVKNMLGMST